MARCGGTSSSLLAPWPLSPRAAHGPSPPPLPLAVLAPSPPLPPIASSSVTVLPPLLLSPDLIAPVHRLIQSSRAEAPSRCQTGLDIVTLARQMACTESEICLLLAEHEAQAVRMSALSHLHLFLPEGPEGEDLDFDEDAEGEVDGGDEHGADS